ncbi:MAG: hypothetical protein ACTHLY_00280 [Pseudolabrys sp.]
MNITFATAIAILLFCFSADARPVYLAPPSALACERAADAYAQRASLQGEVFGTTALSSLGGFGIGSIFAASGVGAAIGAAVGIIGGLAIRQQKYDRIYVAAFNDCMNGRPFPWR